MLFENSQGANAVPHRWKGEPREVTVKKQVVPSHGAPLQSHVMTTFLFLNIYSHGQVLRTYFRIDMILIIYAAANISSAHYLEPHKSRTLQLCISNGSKCLEAISGNAHYCCKILWPNPNIGNHHWASQLLKHGHQGLLSLTESGYHELLPSFCVMLQAASLCRSYLWCQSINVHESFNTGLQT